MKEFCHLRISPTSRLSEASHSPKNGCIKAAQIETLIQRDLGSGIDKMNLKLLRIKKIQMGDKFGDELLVELIEFSEVTFLGSPHEKLEIHIISEFRRSLWG